MTLRFVSIPKACGLMLSAIFVCFSTLCASAQVPQSRITQKIVDADRVVLPGHVHPLAAAKYDRGALDDSTPVNRIMMLLSRTAAQQVELDKLLEEQQTPGSANYHRWLTPEEFGAKFGVADADVQKVTAWLASHGFTVEKVAASKTLIEFSGNAGQVRNAFKTELHKFVLPTGTYDANNAEPQIPAALAPVVRGFASLNNFPRKSYARVRGTALRTPSGTIRPQWTGSDSSGNLFYAIGPGDFATIYNSMPLLQSGTTGAGQTIGIVGQSNISLTDVANYRALFGLSAGDYSVVVDGTDPGIVSGDEGESVMDVQLAGGVAPGAAVRLVIAETTGSSSGVDLAAQYIVDHNLTDIISESYGACERALGSSNAFYNDLWGRAAAQGITVLVSTGDDGSAGCEDPNKATVSQGTLGGLSVNGIASTPYNVAVGGTDFNNAASLTSYWNSSSTSGTRISAKGYIPEMTWNDSCAHSATASFLTPCANAVVSTTNPPAYESLQLWAGSGGPSTVYPKPSWQTGTGVPSDGARDIPDVSLFAAGGDSGSNSFYVSCQADNQGANCVKTSNGILFLSASGTSASAPSFAGIVALAGQQVGNQRLGNINYLLYKIAAQNGASCASSGTPASSCVFYDTQVGNISVPCAPGSLNCSLSSGTTKGILVAGGAPAYMTTAGYDTATGLGSVNITNLVAAIAGLAVPTVATPTASLINISRGSSTTLSVTVTGNSTLGAPTGTITFKDGSTTIGTASTVSNSSTFTLTGTRTYTPTTSGTHTITATIGAAGGYAANASSALTITVTSLAAATISTPTSTSTSLTVGNSAALTVMVTGTSSAGVPTGTITFKDGTTSLGTATLSSNSANFTLTGTLSNYTPSTTGTHTITANYSGDSNYNAATSAALTVTANAAFTQSLQSNAVTISSAGGSGTNTITFTPASSGVPASTTISYYCSSGSTAASCTPTSAAPGSIPVNAGAVTANVTYTVPALAASAKPADHLMPWRLGGGLLVAGVFVFAVPGVRRRGQCALMLIVIGALTLAASCGGGGGSTSTPPTPKTYTFTVTATTTAYGVTTTQTSSFTVTN